MREALAITVDTDMKAPGADCAARPCIIVDIRAIQDACKLHPQRPYTKTIRQELDKNLLL